MAGLGQEVSKPTAASSTIYLRLTDLMFAPTNGVGIILQMKKRGVTLLVQGFEANLVV